MKTILAPSTDFSIASLGAMDYAAAFAKFTGARLILLHIYASVMKVKELEMDYLKRLKEIEQDLYRIHGTDLKIECIYKMGFAVEEFDLAVKEYNVNLVVMGLLGTEGNSYMSELLAGSFTTEFIKEAKCPVLVLNENAKFSKLKKIVFACEFGEIVHIASLQALKEFAGLFKSLICVLYVISEPEIHPSPDIAAIETGIGQFLKETNLSFHYIENGNIVEGINKFVIDNKADMVVMIPHKLSFIKDIFHKRNTKQMAFHSIVPLLTLPELEIKGF